MHFRQHIHRHAKEANHFLAMDLSYGQTYCFLCQDYVYDKDVELIAQVWNQLKFSWQKLLCLVWAFCIEIRSGYL